jgi:hypothetical protein
MPTEFHTGHRNSGPRERLRHRTRLQQRNDFVLKFVAIHRSDEIDQAAFGTAGVEAGNQMTNANRQALEPLAKKACRAVAGTL